MEFLMVALFLGSLYQMTAVNAQDTNCTTPDQEGGSCINIRNCPQLLNLLKTTKENREARNFLQKSQCGAHAEVCCPVAKANQLGGGEDTKRRLGQNNANEAVCGVSEAGQQNRIIGGQPAEVGAWPWIAALGYRAAGSRQIQWKCGGSLIHKRYILTAAHCIRTPPGSGLTLSVIRLGGHDLVNEVEGATPIDFSVESTIVHESYRSQQNDIALIRLNKDVKMTDKIRAICLPGVSSLRTSKFEGKFPFVAGWGETELNGPSSSVLLQTQVLIVDNEPCKSTYAKYGADITQNHLCAGQGGKDSCRGDSGGPLMLPEGGIYYQIGIISFGYRCAEPGNPGVYTRVTSYLDWINRKIQV